MSHYDINLDKNDANYVPLSPLSFLERNFLDPDHIAMIYKLPGNTNLIPRQASAVEDLRTIATSRLMLDNFPHIKAYWVMIGEQTASIAINFGASDLDGTIGEERIAHAAKAASPVGLARTRMLRLIGDAGKIPVERDALYNEIHVYDS